MPDETSQSRSVDLSPLHHELDALKHQLCTCQHEGTCLACRGFEVLREQSQMVVAAASQPVLLQVAQEASVNDLMQRMGSMQESLMGKMSEDAELQGLMARVMERIQDDLGGPEAMEQLMRQMGMSPDGSADGPVPYDDRPTPPASKPPTRDTDPPPPSE